MCALVVSSSFWKASLPDGWLRLEREPKEVVYFESPDHTAGIYFSTWRINGQSLSSALEDTRRIERRNLPKSDHGHWEALRDSQVVKGSEVESIVEYFNRVDKYRILSRLLGRDDQYIRVTYHDYGCVDLKVSAERSDPIVGSVVLTESSPNE